VSILESSSPSTEPGQLHPAHLRAWPDPSSARNPRFMVEPQSLAAVADLYGSLAAQRLDRGAWKHPGPGKWASSWRSGAGAAG
jgi:hypothetical protein